MTYGDAISALADPTRRAIINRLRGGALPVGKVAEGLAISRPAVSQHLRVLSDAELLIVTPQGNRRLYSLAPEGIDKIRHYLDELWKDALSTFPNAATEQVK